MPKLYDVVKKLSVETGLSEAVILRIVSTAPERYKQYYIRKKNGGFRKVAQPAREVKILQRAFVDIMLARLPVHPAATAYIRGKSIRDNASAHSLAGPILKMDFKDFFPSITERDWAAYCYATGCLTDPEEVRWTSKLLFHRPIGGRLLRLAIGAPSSPVVSNILMFHFDKLVTEAASQEHVTYTRYADDLTFSGPRTGHLTGIPKTMKKIVRDLPFPTLKINHEKTNRVTKKFHRQVTGLTLANDGRVTVGRDRKRLIRAQIDYYKRGLLDGIGKAKLAGNIAFVKSVEPAFFLCLLEKYGHEMVSAILSQSNQKRISHRRATAVAGR